MNALDLVYNPVILQSVINPVNNNVNKERRLIEQPIIQLTKFFKNLNLAKLLYNYVCPSDKL